MKHYTVELRIREAGDVGDAWAVKAIVELPMGEVMRGFFDTVGGALQWAMEKAWEWMRNRESAG